MVFVSTSLMVLCLRKVIRECSQMNVHQIEKDIKSRIVITDHDVALAKSFILNQHISNLDISQIFEQYLRENNCSSPKVVFITEGADIDKAVINTSRFFTLRISFTDACWDLVHKGFFYPPGNLVPNHFERIAYDTGNQRNSWLFSEFNSPMPLVLQKCISRGSVNKSNIPLFDAQIYMKEANMLHAHKEVKEAIDDAIKCFTNELYRPAIMMLGKAVEGAWIELGLSLAQHLPQEIQDRYMQRFTGTEDIGIKVLKVIEMYSTHKQEFLEIRKQSNASVDALKMIQTFSDLIRNSRNAIHFGATPISENSYAKVSTVLLTAAQYFELMYRCKSISDANLPSVRHEVIKQLEG